MNTRQEDVPPPLIPRYTWLLSRYPNFAASFTRPLREVAVRHLCLNPGTRVLDVGCGTGASSPFLVQAVGPDGEVVGVDISPDLAAIAKKGLSKRNGTTSISLSAQPKPSPSQVGLTACCCSRRTRCSPRQKPWIICFPISKKEGRIVAFGAKLSNSRRGRLLNPLLRLLTQTLLPASSAPVDARPWRFLEDRTGKLHMDERMAGLLYLVWGCGPRESAASAR
jgi:hypothetical protein